MKRFNEYLCQFEKPKDNFNEIKTFILEKFDKIFEFEEFKKKKEYIEVYVNPKKQEFKQLLESNENVKDFHYIKNNLYIINIPNIGNINVNFIINQNDNICDLYKNINEVILRILEIFARSLGYKLCNFGISLKILNKENQIKNMFLTSDTNKIFQILGIKNIDNNIDQSLKNIIMSNRFDTNKFVRAIKRDDLNKIPEDKLEYLRKINKNSEENNNYQYETNALGNNFKIYLNRIKNNEKSHPDKIENKDINKWISEILEIKSPILIESAKEYIGYKYGKIINNPINIAKDLIHWFQNN